MKKIISLLLVLSLTVICAVSCSVIEELGELIGIVDIDPQDPENPDPENPDPENPDPENPDPENPDPEQPDPEQPDPEQPDPEQPDPEQPDPEQPDPEQPDPEEPDNPKDPADPDEPGTPSDPTEPDTPAEPEKPAMQQVTVSKTADELGAEVDAFLNGDKVVDEVIPLDNNISVVFGKGTANTDPAIYSGAIRVYQAGGTVSITAKGGAVLEKIVITTADSKYGGGKLQVENGSAPTLDGNVLTIIVDKNATTVTITAAGAGKGDRLYVANLEVVYLADSASVPEQPDGPDDGGISSSFTEEEQQSCLDYVGFVPPMIPTDYYYLEPYAEDGYKGIYLLISCASEAEFEEYLALLSDFESDEPEVDEDGVTWYLFYNGDVLIDVCYYDYEGTCYIILDAYLEDGGSDNDGGNTDPAPDTNKLYTDFTSSEKKAYTDLFGFVIPFLATDDYIIEEYNESGYAGIYVSFLCETNSEFRSYLALFSVYTSDGTEQDSYGDTWYLYSKGDVYIDVCYYEYDGDYYADVDVYCESGSGSGGSDNGGNNDGNNGGSTNSDLITNEGAGLPEDDGDGVYDVDFTDATNVKDVTDQGYYVDGCPTTGSPAVLVIPVQFSDKTAASQGYDINKIVEAFKKGGKTDYYSVYDYYYISSYGQLTLDITVVDSWFQPKYSSSYYASQTMDYYGSETAIGDQMVLDEALSYLSKTMDLSRFDSDGNGIIDSVILITTLDISYDDFYWAYRYWNIYTDEEGYYYEYDGVSANDYLWASYGFLQESYDRQGNVSYDDKTLTNTYTYIHEFGHILGSDDYYDTEGVGEPLGGFDVMDAMAGDHNAFTKFNYGWLTASRLVVTNGSVTLTLEEFSKNGDTVIIANNWSDELGAYQEYFIVVYYTNTGLNSGAGGYFEEEGILVYHVNASLYSEDYDGEIYYDIYNNNTDPSGYYGTEDNLIELVVGADGDYVFEAGEQLGTVTEDDGDKLIYTFTVESIAGGLATVTFSNISA